MLRYEASPGIFDISDEICGTFDEEDVAVAVEEMPELDPFMSVGGLGPNPESTSASFRRSVGWPWTQTLFIDVKSTKAIARRRSEEDRRNRVTIPIYAWYDRTAF
jgi:hypothetical protein